MKSRLFLSTNVIASVIILGSCITERPPESGDPDPQPHHGIYVCESDTLIFNGDGESISWHFSTDIPELDNQGSGTYVFTIGTRGEQRYDLADRFSIYQDSIHSLRFSTFNVTDSIIPITPITDEENLEMVFKKMMK